MKDIRGDVEFIYNDFGNTLLVNENQKFDLNNPELGYCYKYGNIYNVFVAKTGDLRNDLCVKLHEYGHIYLGHLDGIHEELDSLLLRAINDNRDDLVDHINKSCKIDFANKLLDRVIDDPVLNHTLHNIAMDMEVNSKILDLDDVTYQEKTVSDMLPAYQEEMLKYIQDHTDDQAKKDEIQKAIDMMSKETKIKLIHPSRYHNPDDTPFPSELTYPDYLLKIVLGLDQFVKMMVSISKGGNGDTSGVSDQDVQDALNGGSGQSGMDSLDKMMSDSGIGENKSDINSTKSKDNPGIDSPYKGQRDGSGQQDQSGNGNKDHRTDSRDDADKKRELGQIKSEGGKGCGSSGGPDATRLVAHADEIEMVLDEVFNTYKSHVLKRDFKRDTTYKYNRGILKNVISPSYRQKITISEDPRIVFIIDISGSMDTQLVDRILTTIPRKMRKLGRGLLYDILTWSTRKGEHIKDIDPRKPVPRISMGGGTSLAGAIDYFKDNYDPSAIMIMISDFEDYLEEWRVREEKMNEYTMYGFNYGRKVNVKWKNLKVRDFRQ